MIEPEHPKLSITKQCKLLGINRSSYYYKPVPLSEKDLMLMRVMDTLYIKDPTFGTRRMAAALRRKGFSVGRRHVRTLMRLMGLFAIYQRPRTTIPNKSHKVYPYLLRGLDVTHPNQVWSSDITYIPMSKGFMYLVVVMDWHSRKVLSWRLSNTMEDSFCVDALNSALALYDTPEIFNTDQGSQFTSKRFTEILKNAGVKISMDGKGRWIDNVFVERLWRSLKYEKIYINAYETPRELRRGIAEWFEYFNSDRPHQSLDDRTPDEVYYGYQSETMAA